MSFIDKELIEESEDLARRLRKRRQWLNDDEKNYTDDSDESKDYLEESGGAHNRYVDSGKDKKDYQKRKEMLGTRDYADSYRKTDNEEIRRTIRDHAKENKKEFRAIADSKEHNKIHDKVNKNYEKATGNKFNESFDDSINVTYSDLIKESVNTEGMTSAQKYDHIIREYFDITDRDTRKILVSVSEADKGEVLSSLTNKLYNNIIDKAYEIDFGTIPNSKGDITKIDNYDNMRECLNILRGIMVEYKQGTKNNIDVIEESINHIMNRKDLFTKAFQMNLELPIMIYSTTVLSIVSSISFMISSCIEFIKSPNQDTFDFEIDKLALNKSKDNLLFVNLSKFNIACRTGQVDSTINFVIKNKVKNFTGAEIGLIAGGIVIMGILLNIIPILRELIFFFYFTRVRIADYFEIQADLLQMNAYNIEHDQSVDPEERKKIAKKQMKIVENFRKVSNVVNIDNKNCEVKTTKEIKKINSQKYKHDDVLDSLPDSVASSIF